MNKFKIFYLLVFLSIFSCKTQQKSQPQNQLFELFDEDPNSKPFFSDKKGVIASHGMVASAHPAASQVGVDILKMGGNAIDASIATHFALAVAFPFAGNIGGGGFTVIRLKNGESFTLDYREKAPLKASKDMYLDALGNIIEGLSTKGHLASGTPGSVDGMVALHEKYGKLAWEKLIQPAIDLAQKGVVLTEREAIGFNNNNAVFKEVNGADCPYFSKPDGGKWQKSDVLIQNDLGQTLLQIQKNKRAGFYEGPVAKLLIDEMKIGKGIISYEDLKKYSSVWRKPIVADYKNYKIITMAPPSSGGIALVQLLRFIEPLNIGKMAWHGADATQVMIEAERRVYADRAKWLGDPDFVKVPVNELINRNYLKSRWADFNPAFATESKNITGGTIAGFESNETTHYAVVDADGNAVATTTTLNGAYGSKVIVKGGGFLMNNEMDDFSSKAGVPNMFGLVGSKANEIAPEKRMLSSMTPTIVEKDGKFFFSVGSPGGSTIITSVFQTIVNVTEYNMSMQQAVNALKFHHQWLPDKTFFETNAFSNKTLETLRAKKYSIDAQKGTLGRMDCIMRLPNGKLEGASDPRADNTSIGY